MSSTRNGFNSEPIVVSPQGFRIRRATATAGGFRPAVDQRVQEVLTELQTLLAKRIVDPAELDTLKEWLRLELTPRRVARAGVGKWDDASLAHKLQAQKESDTERTFTDVIDGDPDLAKLRYKFNENLDERWNELDFNTRTVLGYPGVRDLLVLRAFYLLGITQQSSLMNFVLTHFTGVAQVVSYAAVGATRGYVAEKQLRVKGIDEDDTESVTTISKAGLLLSAEAMPRGSIDIIQDFLDSSKYDDLIEKGSKVKAKDLPAYLKPRLIEYIKHSTIEVTEENAPFIVPMYLARAATSPGSSGGSPSDDPFAVLPFVDDSSVLHVSTAAVRCSAQLYYVMVLGEELAVFDAVRYFTHRYLFREGFAVEDPQLRRDLENYVFSEQFPGIDDLTGEPRMMRCTRSGERRSFYRQVFDQGKEPVPGDGMANSDFGRLWKILMLESARYLERAQASPHPDSFVSRQNVLQAVEDLQYNLSTSCVGMATVMTPLMYAELDFVVRRILDHAEVRKHLVPSGGSWWKVVERLQAGQGQRCRATVLNNKALIGYELIRSIADYVPSEFEADGPFSKFISNVDAFITTQSILQEEGSRSGGPGRDVDAQGVSGYGDGDGAGGRDGYGSGRLPGMPDLSRLPGMPSIPGVSTPWPGGERADEGGAGDVAGGVASNGVSNGVSHGVSGAVGGSPGDSGPSSAGDWDF